MQGWREYLTGCKGGWGEFERARKREIIGRQTRWISLTKTQRLYTSSIYIQLVDGPS